MKPIEHIPLNTNHEHALASFLSDFDAHGEANIPAYFAPREWTHQRIVDTFDGWTRGEGLKDNWTPCFTRFAVDSGAILGVYNIRHLNNAHLDRSLSHVGYSVRPSARGRGIATAMLADAQQFAYEHQLAHLILTCDQANPASRRVIEHRGGVLLEHYPENGRITLRFQVPTQPI